MYELTLLLTYAGCMMIGQQLNGYSLYNPALSIAYQSWGKIDTGNTDYITSMWPLLLGPIAGGAAGGFYKLLIISHSLLQTLEDDEDDMPNTSNLIKKLNSIN